MKEKSEKGLYTPMGIGLACTLLTLPSTMVLAESPTQVPRRSKLVGELIAVVPGVYIHGLGHLYAADYKGALILGGVELAGIGLMALGGGITVGDRARSERETTAQSAAILGGAVLFFGSWLWDVVYTPRQVERRNVRYGHEPKSLISEVGEDSRKSGRRITSVVRTLRTLNPPSAELHVPRSTLGLRIGGGLLDRTGGGGRYEVHAGFATRYKRSLIEIGWMVDRYENLVPDALLLTDDDGDVWVVLDSAVYPAKLRTRWHRMYLTAGYTLFRYRDMIVIPKIGFFLGYLGQIAPFPISFDGIGSLEFRWPMFSIYSTVKTLTPFAPSENLSGRWTVFVLGAAFHFNVD